MLRGKKMYVKELWRYPVKSLAGESLESAQIGDLGLAGDRKVLVCNEKGRVITSRTHPKLLGLKGSLGSGSHAYVSGHLWTSPDALALIREAAGPTSNLVSYEGPERFDVLPLLVATDGAIDAFGHDRRRLRPNIIIGGVEGLAERAWPGKHLRIGEVLIGVQDLRGRCVMTTFDPDTLKQDPNVLKEIVQKFDGELALNCYVISGGAIGVGDSVHLASDRVSQ
jgi:uncharacterized protein